MPRKEKEDAKQGKDQLDAYFDLTESHNTGEASSRTNILLHEYAEAAKRTRTSLIAICIISILLFIGVFNHQWTWLATKEYRQHEIEWKSKLKDPINPSSYLNTNEALIAAINRLAENDKPTYPRHQIHELLEVEMKTIEVPILGLQIYIEDMPILGGLGVLLLLLWFYFVRRRERSIVKILNVVTTFAKPEERKYQIKKIYTSLAFSQVFNYIPYVDNVKKPKLLEWLTFWKRSIHSSLFFSYHMPFIPCFVILFVLAFDIYETFELPSDHKLVPDVVRLDTIYHLPIFQCDVDTCMVYKSKAADSIYERREEDVNTFLVRNVERIRKDSLTIIESRIQELDSISNLCTDSLNKWKEIIYNEGTTYSYYLFNEHRFKDFIHHHPRMFNLSMPTEIIWIRSVLPTLILILNFIMAGFSLSIAKSRDFHMSGIQIQYGKYYPQNYDIYTIPYAYVSILLVDKAGVPIKDVMIHAVNNYRTMRTDRNGIARFIELQELDNTETIEFHFKTEKSHARIKMPGKFNLIARYGNEYTLANKPNKYLEDKISETLKRSNSVKRPSWLFNDNENKPISQRSGKPITRLDATKELVKGEMLLKYVNDGNNVFLQECAICE
ncbi:MAG: hypothetical protein RL641_437 [Candidatus Parcubacteria bacterium]|jgi:hypothetical protein